MGQILIRNLDESTIRRLKKRAAARGTSMEQEARRSLAEDKAEALEAWLARVDALRRRIGRLPGPSSTELLREDRDRDNDR